MLWGATLRSPHPRAASGRSTSPPRSRCPACTPCSRTRTSPAARPTAWSTPTSRCWPCDNVRFQGEPVAIVAADHPETARRAAAAIEVDYEVLEPLTDRRGGDRRPTRRAAPGGNVLRHVRIDHGDPDADRRRRRHRRVRGRHAGPGLPRPRVRAWPCPTATAASTSTSRPSGCTSTATSSPRASACRRRRSGSRSPASAARSAAREDLSMQIHACMLALHTGRPVKIVYNREESFFGHVHRHPARCATSTARRATATSSTCARGSCSTAARTPRRSTAVVLERAPASPPARTTCRTRASTRYVDLHEQPAVRRDARVRRGAGRVRPRGADGQAGRRARHGPGRAAHPQRDGAGHRACRPAR